MKYKNRGSATLEITLIMPVILLIMVLCITLLLGAYRQAKMHSDLVVYSIETTWGYGSEENADVKTIAEGDLIIYTQDDVIQLARQYKLESSIEQRKRISETEEKLRRWQIIGDVISQ